MEWEWESNSAELEVVRNRIHQRASQHHLSLSISASDRNVDYLKHRFAESDQLRRVTAKHMYVCWNATHSKTLKAFGNKTYMRLCRTISSKTISCRQIIQYEAVIVALFSYSYICSISNLGTIHQLHTDRHSTHMTYTHTHTVCVTHIQKLPYIGLHTEKRQFPTFDSAAFTQNTTNESISQTVQTNSFPIVFWALLVCY